MLQIHSYLKLDNKGVGMVSEETKRREQELHELTGALAAINALQEKLKLLNLAGLRSGNRRF